MVSRTALDRTRPVINRSSRGCTAAELEQHRKQTQQILFFLNKT